MHAHGPDLPALLQLLAAEARSAHLTEEVCEQQTWYVTQAQEVGAEPINVNMRHKGVVVDFPTKLA